jgi:hypothetical protein
MDIALRNFRVGTDFELFWMNAMRKGRAGE